MCNVFPLVFLCGSVEDVVQDCTVRSFGFVGVFKAPVSCVLWSVVSQSVVFSPHCSIAVVYRVVYRASSSLVSHIGYTGIIML